MHTLDLNFLALILGLSVYVSSIRFVVIGRLIGESTLSDDRKERYKTFLRWLIPADVLLVVAGVLLFLHIFWKNLFGENATSPECFACVIVWCAFLGVLWLACHHVVSWFKTLRA